MVLCRGLVDFPEVAGMPFNCSGCGKPNYSEQSVSVSMFRDKKEGGTEMVQFLMCFTCVTMRADCKGEC